MELQKRLDKVFACKNLFYCSENERKEIKEYLIPAAFEYHFENCSLYKNYCEKIGIDPSKIKKIEDISKIPLLPSSIFKNQTVISGNKTDIVKKCTSSGTKGTVSCVYRDMNTIKNFFQSSKKNIVDLLNVENGECINLTPVSDAPEVKHLWLPYAMEYVEKFFPTVYCVEKGVLNVEKVYQNLDRMLKDKKTAILMGPPTLFIKLVESMKKSEISFQGGSRIRFITAGGWKKFTGISIGRSEFREKMSECFGDIEDWQYRDLYNMVELNTIIGECEFNNKHILPWLSVFSLNPSTLKPVEEGRDGVIAFIDPTATSYPCFVLSDDLGKVFTNIECKCGRSGDVLQFSRRISTTEVRGCALKMDKQFEIGK